MFLWRNGLQAREIKAQLVRTNEYVKLIWQCVNCTYIHMRYPTESDGHKYFINNTQLYDVFLMVPSTSREHSACETTSYISKKLKRWISILCLCWRLCVLVSYVVDV
jgi:hypothetical protein